MKKIVIVVLFIAVLAGAILWVKWNAVAPAPDVTTPVKNVLDVKNATYDIDGVLITLKDGQNEQKVPGSVTITTTSYFGNNSKGDLNGDGKEDMSFLLIQDGGGTGLFTYLAVAISKDVGFESPNTIFIGDRIAPQNTQIKDGIITVNYADRLPNEPMSAQPSRGVSRIFKVENKKLVEIKGEFGEVQ